MFKAASFALARARPAPGCHFHPPQLLTKAAASYIQVRCLNLHEYQSKQLMAKHNINVQRFSIAETVEQAQNAAVALHASEIVVKAQIHAGARGKGMFSSGLKSGVHLTRDAAHVPNLVSQMLGYNLVTPQTSSEGVPVHKVMIAEALDLLKETYFAILMCRETGGPLLIGSPKGGMDIEAVAEEFPNLIYKESVDINEGPTEKQTTDMAMKLGFTGKQIAEASDQMQRLYELFVEVDAVQVEINPFGLAKAKAMDPKKLEQEILEARGVKEGEKENEDKVESMREKDITTTTPTPTAVATDDGTRVVCFDAKISFDDNASFKHADLLAMRDTTEEDPLEVEAEACGLSYVSMDGNIGCLVNGAGLALATMDIIKLHGAEPANFLDVGGGVTEKQVSQAFNILSQDDQVKTILINIFGGIASCLTIAQGVVAALKTSPTPVMKKMPIVIRLQGNQVEEGKKWIEEAGLKNVVMRDDLDEAAAESVRLAGGGVAMA